MNASKLIFAMAVVLLFTGCSKSPTLPDPEPTDTIYGSGDASTGDTYGDGNDVYGQGGDIYDDSMDPTGGELDTVIYFEFDSSEVGPDYTDMLARHSMLLLDDQQLTVRLDGHADEQGSREYNIGLGERRAQAVRRLLLLQGASPDQIKTVSFGEERPEAFGSDEASYAQNRRVVINYEN